MTLRAVPEGLTDPDAIDAWLEQCDARELHAAADRDAAVMAVAPRSHDNPDAVTDPDMSAAISARIAYDRLPFWERWFTCRPSGMVDRYPASWWPR